MVSPSGTVTGVPLVGGWPYGVTADATNLYWVGGEDANIYARPVVGGPVSVIAPTWYVPVRIFSGWP